MFIYLQHRLGQIQQSVTFWRVCANLIENESLVTSADKKIHSDNGHICKNPSVQLNYRLISPFWKQKSLPKLYFFFFFTTVNNSHA